MQTEGKQTRRGYSVQGAMNTSKSADNLPTHMDGARMPKTWSSGMQFSLDSKIQWCITRARKRTKMHLRQTGSSRLLPTSTAAIVKDRLCRPSAKQPQPYSKGQLRFTSYRKSTEKMENQQRCMTKTTLHELGQLIQSLSVYSRM